MLEVNVRDETARLKSVVLGIADSVGGVPALEDAYDPKSKQNIRMGTFPKEEDMKGELDQFNEVFERYRVKVYRPEVLPGVNQVFARDIGFVIDDIFVISNILAKRDREIEGIEDLIAQMDPKKVMRMPEGTRIEGGDVMPWKGRLFIGYSEEDDFQEYMVARTNRAAIDFMIAQFPHYEVYPFQLNKSDTDPMENALHLDCCFQPIGTNQCIIYPGGFKNPNDVETLIGIFGKENMIIIDQQEMYDMNSNVFSISPEVIVSEKDFTRLNEELRQRDFQVEEIDFSEIAKMEGLLRCTTLPLEREY